MDSDLLKGATAIGEFIGRTRKAVYHMADAGTLPVFKIGGVIYARKSTLREFFAHMELKQAKS